MEKEQKLQPRRFRNKYLPKDCKCTLSDQSDNCHCNNVQDTTNPSIVYIDDLTDEIDRMTDQSKHTSSDRGSISMNRRLHLDTDLMEEKRGSLRRFEPLSIRNKTLSGMSIGGFDIDLSVAAQKASEVIPLPASKLPVIFVDQELNFYHHFFQGMEYIFSRDLISSIVSEDRYYSRAGLELIQGISHMIDTGYERGDSELVIFIKKTITSTFELLHSRIGTSTNDKLSVATNLWGFQYIEPGMQCGIDDLCMWLIMCYGHYKTLWFNTFKSTGVPGFAYRKSQGVPEYHRSPSSLQVTKETYDPEYEKQNNPGESEISPRRSELRSVRSHRSRKNKSKELQMTRWIAGK
jgi:hypothetical protein